MSALIKNIDTENCLRELLRNEGYNLSPTKKAGELGTDIIATKNNEKWYIEVIGYKKSGPACSKDFFEVFFRAISRLNHKNCRHCVIAMPNKSRNGLPLRTKIYKVSWKRIANTFPKLEIWLVDTENKKYFKTTWLEWL